MNIERRTPKERLSKKTKPFKRLSLPSFSSFGVRCSKFDISKRQKPIKKFPFYAYFWIALNPPQASIFHIKYFSIQDTLRDPFLMKNIQKILFLALISLAIACNKEEPVPVAPTPPVQPPVYVPIYEPGDTSKGAAYANKLTAFWRAEVYCKTAYLDTSKIGIVFYTYAKDGSLREILVLGAVPKQNGQGSYTFHTNPLTPAPAGTVSTSYGTFSSDGDVAEDYYRVDSTDQKNGLTITRIDLFNKRVEGTFDVSYNLQEPRRNPQNPLKVTFSEGRFWATIRD